MNTFDDGFQISVFLIARRRSLCGMLLRTPTIVVGSSIHACTVIRRSLYRRPFLTYIKEWPCVH